MKKYRYYKLKYSSNSSYPDILYRRNKGINSPMEYYNRYENQWVNTDCSDIKALIRSWDSYHMGDNKRAIIEEIGADEVFIMLL